ncbi:MAG: OmpA family protein [Pseudomonadota bacterium]
MTRYALCSVVFAALLFGGHSLGRWGAAAFESMQVQRIASGLEVLGMRWARIEADGLRIELHGHAPDMFARELALESARVSAPLARVESFATATLAPPTRRDPVRIDLHRSAERLVMTGQTASRAMRTRLNEALATDAPDLTLSDLTGIQAAEPPAGWGPEIDIASLAAGNVENAYVVVEPGVVRIKGNVANAEVREALTQQLVALARTDVTLDLQIGIPPRVIAPFSFSAWKEPGGTLIPEQCAARTVAEAAEIAGLVANMSTARHIVPCIVGLGGPPGNWPDALAAAMAALDALPAGRVDVEFRYARLIGMPPTPPALFEEVTASFQAAMPEGYVAETRLDSQDIATRTGIGRERFWMRLVHNVDGVTLTGEVPHATASNAIVTYAAALFGTARVETHLAAVDRAAPPGWTTAALRMLDALYETDDGTAELAGHRAVLSATTRDPVAAALLHKALGVSLPGFDVSTELIVDVPAAVAATAKPPLACAAALGRIVEATPIDFAPGSAVITDAAEPVLDVLAETFEGCAPALFEIGGHTDSQGSEDLNQRLSLGRAKAVVTGLLDRGVAPERLIPRGYGESQPIADNATDAGRARNRRIEFRPAEG